MQLTGSKRLKDGRTVLPAGQYTKPTENQAIMNFETGEIITPSLKDQRIAKMIEDNKKRKKEADGSLSLAELKGSEKQIKWASDIRQKFVSALSSVDDVLNYDPGLFSAKETQNLKRNLNKLFQSEDKASFWIELRGFDVTSKVGAWKFLTSRYAEDTLNLFR